MAAMAVLPGPPPRRTPRLQLQTSRAPAPHLPCRHCHTAVDDSHPTTTSPTRTHQVTRRRIRAPPGRAPATRHTRVAAAARLTSTPSTTVSPMSLQLVNKMFHCKTHVSVLNVKNIQLSVAPMNVQQTMKQTCYLYLLNN